MSDGSALYFEELQLLSTDVKGFWPHVKQEFRRSPQRLEAFVGCMKALYMCRVTTEEAMERIVDICGEDHNHLATALGRMLLRGMVLLAPSHSQIASESRARAQAQAQAEAKLQEMEQAQAQRQAQAQVQRQAQAQVQAREYLQAQARAQSQAWAQAQAQTQTQTQAQTQDKLGMLALHCAAAAVQQRQGYDSDVDTGAGQFAGDGLPQHPAASGSDFTSSDDEGPVLSRMKGKGKAKRKTRSKTKAHGKVGPKAKGKGKINARAKAKAKVKAAASMGMGDTVLAGARDAKNFVAARSAARGTQSPSNLESSSPTQHNYNDSSADDQQNPVSGSATTRSATTSPRRVRFVNPFQDQSHPPQWAPPRPMSSRSKVGGAQNDTGAIVEPTSMHVSDGVTRAGVANCVREMESVLQPCKVRRVCPAELPVNTLDVAESSTDAETGDKNDIDLRLHDLTAQAANALSDTAVPTSSDRAYIEEGGARLCQLLYATVQHIRVPLEHAAQRQAELCVRRNRSKIKRYMAVRRAHHCSRRRQWGVKASPILPIMSPGNRASEVQPPVGHAGNNSPGISFGSSSRMFGSRIVQARRGGSGQSSDRVVTIRLFSPVPARAPCAASTQCTSSMYGSVLIALGYVLHPVMQQQKQRRQQQKQRQNFENNRHCERHGDHGTALDIHAPERLYPIHTVKRRPSVLPLVVPTPRTATWSGLRQNIRGDDDPELRYVPYFGDDDQDSVDVSAFDRLPSREKKTMESAVDQAVLLQVLSRFGTSANVLTALSAVTGVAPQLLRSSYQELVVRKSTNMHSDVERLGMRKRKRTSGGIVDPAVGGLVDSVGAQSHNSGNCVGTLHQQSGETLASKAMLPPAELAARLGVGQGIHIHCASNKQSRIVETRRKRKRGEHTASAAAASATTGGSTGETNQTSRAADVTGTGSTAYSSYAALGPDGRGIRADQRNYNAGVGSFRDLFCRRCFRYDCKQHGTQHAYPRQREDPLGSWVFPISSNREKSIPVRAPAPVSPKPAASSSACALPGQCVRRRPCSYGCKWKAKQVHQRLTYGMKGSSGGEIHRLCLLAADSIDNHAKECVLTDIDVSDLFDFGGASGSDGDEDCSSEHVASKCSSYKNKDSWTAAEIMMFDRGRLVAQDDCCAIAQIIQTKPCWQVWQRLRQCLKLEACTQKQDPRSTRARVRARGGTLSNKTIHARIQWRRRQQLKAREERGVATTEPLESLVDASAPCDHDGPCTDASGCSCRAGLRFCTKYCACSRDCSNRFPGCACRSGGCQTDNCPCFAAGRECDPDQCGSCEAWITDDMQQNELKQWSSGRRTKRWCQNTGLQNGSHKRVLLGRSSIHGWGAFVGESVKKNELLAEFVGEVVSQDEADRRGKVYDKNNSSFLFNLNEDDVIDATRHGHKIKYVNHNKQPNAFPRVSVANGDHRIGFYAKRDLVPGEEISIDYGGCDTQENLHIPTWLDASKSDLLHDLISRPKKR